MPTATLIVVGTVPAKKSSMRRSKGFGMHHDQLTKQQLDSCLIQMISQWAGRDYVVHPEVHLRMRFKRASRDRDGAEVAIWDLMQKAGVIKNDNCKWCNGLVCIHPAEINPDLEERVEIELKW